MNRGIQMFRSLVVLLAVLISSAASQAAGSDTSLLNDGTPLNLRMTKTLSAADARVGDKVTLEVVDEVELKDRPVIAAGALVTATVVTAEAHKGRGHDGKLVLHLDYVALADGETVEVRVSPNAKDLA